MLILAFIPANIESLNQIKVHVSIAVSLCTLAGGHSFKVELDGIGTAIPYLAFAVANYGYTIELFAGILAINHCERRADVPSHVNRACIINELNCTTTTGYEIGAVTKGSAVRRLKWYASWVQNVVRQFGPYLSWALDI